MKQVNSQVLLLCSMIDIGNSCSEKLVLILIDCHFIGLTFDYARASHQCLMKRFHCNVLSRINRRILSVNAPLLNLTHLKIMLDVKYSKADIYLAQ